jgi:GcrA cell cycle regulator
MNWTEEQDQYLRDHRGKLSSSQLGAQLGVTRNAVIGRANRIGLEPLRAINSIFDGVNQARRIARDRAPKVKVVKPVQLKVVALPAPTVDDNAIPLEQRRTFFELGAHDCRWPVGDPQEPGFFFCGAVQRDDSPYCAAHHFIAYNRIREVSHARPKFTFVVTTQVLETSADAA